MSPFNKNKRRQSQDICSTFKARGVYLVTTSFSVLLASTVPELQGLMLWVSAVAVAQWAPVAHCILHGNTMDSGSVSFSCVKIHCVPLCKCWPAFKWIIALIITKTQIKGILQPSIPIFPGRGQSLQEGGPAWAPQAMVPCVSKALGFWSGKSSAWIRQKMELNLVH